MKLSTVHMLVTALDGPHHALAVALLREEFDGAIEAQLPLQMKRTEGVSTKRVKAFRERMKRVSETHETGAETFHETPVSSLSCSPSSSPSSSGNSSEKRGEVSTGDARERNGETHHETVHETESETRIVKRVSPVSGNGGRYVAITDEPDAEQVEIASMRQVQDPEAAWAKFCGKYDGQWVQSVSGAWQSFCVSWAKNERTDRERERERAKNGSAPLTADGLDPNSFEASQARKRRQKAEDAEFVRQRLAAEGKAQ